jgi:hypothetical protein
VTSLVVGYLDAKEAANFALTSKILSSEVKKNVCVVVQEYVCWGEAKSGMNWEGQEKTKGQHPSFLEHYASTKENAMTLANKLKKKPLVFNVKIGLQKDFVHMGWWNYGHGITCRLSGKWFYNWNM